MLKEPEPLEPLDGDRMICEVEGDLEVLGTRAQHLAHLINANLNIPMDRPSDWSSYWERVLGPGLIAKIGGTLHSITLLMPDRHEVDAWTLLRSLYETVVLVAWVAASPEDRCLAWYRACMTQELSDHHVLAEAGAPLLDSEAKEQAERWKEIDCVVVPGVRDMARSADKHWSRPRVPWWTVDTGRKGKKTLSSLGGLYRLIFLRGSQAAHSRHRGLDPFVTVTDRRVMAHSEDLTRSYVPFGLAPLTACFALAAAHLSMGWPNANVAVSLLGIKAAGTDSGADDSVTSPPSH